MCKYTLLWIAVVLSGSVAGYKVHPRTRSTPVPSQESGASRWQPIHPVKPKVENKDLALLKRIKADLRRDNDDYTLMTSRRTFRRDGGSPSADQLDSTPAEYNSTKTNDQPETFDTPIQLPDGAKLPSADKLDSTIRTSTKTVSTNNQPLTTSLKVLAQMSREIGSNSGESKTKSTPDEPFSSPNTELNGQAHILTNGKADKQLRSQNQHWVRSEKIRDNLKMGQKTRLQQIIKENQAKLATAISKLAYPTKHTTLSTRQPLPHTAYFTITTEPPRNKSQHAAPSLDMAPATGAKIIALRDKNALCDRNVLDPEGPKYSARGFVMAQEARGWGVTSGDFVLPKCCNCCKKSVLGCL